MRYEKFVMRIKEEDGQTIVIAALAMSIFLFGAIGLAVDGAHMYAQRQMAQSAADAAATAGILTLFDGTNGAPGTGFTASTFTCSTTDTRTPCAYAIKNGFGNSASDTVTVDFPANSTMPGVNFSTTDPVTLIRVTVSRNVSTTLMALLGPTVSTISASATAAIVDVFAPVPILVTHPTKQGSFSMNGTPNVKICGGPSRSIQVNSGNAASNSAVGNSTIDLSHAGPLDTSGTCTTGTGADFGYWGGPSSPPFTFLPGTKPGKYMHASPIQDPLSGVAAPPVPTNTGLMGTHQPLANGTSGCPASPGKACQLYYPGLYTGGIDGKNSTPIFKPGIYYIQDNSGMSCTANCDMYMATGFTDTGANTTNTGWTGNVLFYNTGPSGNSTNAGPFNLGANGTINLVGSPTSSSYLGILFFQAHNSIAQSHALGGGGQMTLQGTIYLTNNLPTMKTTPSQYQSLSLQGGPGSGTLIQGEIIVGTLHLGGNGGITMNLNSNASLLVRQVALVN